MAEYGYPSREPNKLKLLSLNYARAKCQGTNRMFPQNVPIES